MNTWLSWSIWPALMTLVSLGFNVAVLLIGRHVANKIMNNDLHHVKLDIDELKENDKTHLKDDKEYRRELSEKIDKVIDKLDKFHEQVNKINAQQLAHLAVCADRHGKNK